MNFLYLTYLFAIGSVLDITLAIILLNNQHFYANLMGFVMSGVFVVHFSLIELFYRYAMNLKQVFRTRILLTFGNIFVISSVSYMLYCILWDFLG